MLAEEYHCIVRRKIEDILLRSGFICSCFPSVDGDETFLKIYLDPDGDVVRALAEQFEYNVRLSKACYQSTKRITNVEGSLCFAYTPFTMDLYRRGKLQPFRRVDVIRIARRHLSSLIDLEELYEQGFISTHFAVATSEEQSSLKAHWTHPLRFRRALLPQQVGDYFGEKVGFFFHFFAFFVRAIAILGALAFCFFCLFNFVNLDRFQENRCRMVLGAVVVFWALLFEVRFNRSSSRLAQLWGMSAWNVERLMASRDSNLKTFDEKLVGRSRERFGNVAAAFCTVSYCTMFIIGVAAMKMNASVLGQGAMDWAISLVVMVAKWLWGKIAPVLTRWENHKTQQRFDDELFLRLATFKTFFVLWPALSIFLFDKITMAYCGDSFLAAVEAAYGPLSEQGRADGYVQWPQGPHAGEAGMLNESTFEEKLSMYSLTSAEIAFRDLSLDRLLHEDKYSGDEACLAFCLPLTECYQVPSRRSAVDCLTNCHADLHSMIVAQFVTHVAVTLALLLYPMARVEYDIKQEVSAAAQHVQKGGASPTEVGYSVLQVQAKCHLYAKYEYQSFGGSFVEDTMELILGFVYISVFGMVSPAMVVIAAAVTMVEYKLLQTRMIFVTGRPYPEIAADIGSSKKMIVLIGTVGVFINGYLLAFVMGPARSRTFNQKFTIFLCFGAGSLFLRTMLHNVLAGDPRDVRRIDDHNNDVLAKLRPVEIGMEFVQGKHGVRVDLGL
ncbi:unnamed protein product [Prorocentrum cordatum]|uniref:Anoctamin transmembrane domain-containing protein n=1 Tax=Prorocentrum cordatum TaxID=2364126 RepID=A0ABN9XB97_9DINO|nr:unnamed protein product [Polarella glacialis]